ncbi:N-acetylmuramoyl-L-alanine amidase family protein [Paenibacillus sp. y28]|uniref:N-acetylmuramoyl-L-alanine amidase family protein n=1 Tax=Paenibacillus sp. y28 TaxID=3129110 RepID=UPI00301A6BFC
MKPFVRARLLMYLGLFALLFIAAAPVNTASAAPAGLLYPTADVLIDAGHGGVDGGCTFSDILEKDINLAVAQKLYAHLRAQGWNPVLNRTGDYALSEENHWAKASRHNRDLAQRKLAADSLQPRMLVSLHVNWSKRKSANGPVVLYQYTQPSYMLSLLLQQRLNTLYKTNETVQYGKPYYLLNRTRIPAVIVELGFISNARDRNFLTTAHGQDALAEVLADGINGYLLLFDSPRS